eukprot:177917-Chlamydomonas_euryale.AAC.1
MSLVSWRPPCLGTWLAHAVARNVCSQPLTSLRMEILVRHLVRSCHWSLMPCLLLRTSAACCSAPILPVAPH